MKNPIDPLAEAARQNGLTVAVAESLTSGLLASEVGKGAGAGDWFSGGVVAYRMPVKTHVLGVPEDVDPASAACATALATGVRALLGTDIAVSTTGVGGPEPDGEHPAGTVHIGWATSTGSGAHHFQFDGDPEEVLRATVEQALDVLTRLARAETDGGCWSKEKTRPHEGWRVGESRLSPGRWLRNAGDRVGKLRGEDVGSPDGAPPVTTDAVGR
ncbi:CinA family protein [Microbacterium album]|uniref:CinA C-terminal domain-containing protein n=1 Tax=Microbacterium album TaxID=2053191 RepID=A0A917IGJ4_9MICO|nr:CinA family protein [Microbacterium album]GGH48252.1 hypothetical protein GCM10010921_25570 [Microbacterium album]